MKNVFKKVIIGMILGVANIIPGVSGGTMAMSLGIYEELISIVSNIFKKLKKNIMYLLPIGIGMIVSILTLSKVINYTLEKYEFQTILLFIGLILGGMPALMKKTDSKTFTIKNIFISLICFSVVFALSFVSATDVEVSLDVINLSLIIKLLLVGILASATMVIPGISGSFVLMLIGYYKPIVNTLSNLTNFDSFIHNISILIPFGIGVLIGIVLIARIIEYLLKKKQTETYYGIYGIILSSIAIILMNISAIPSMLGLLVGLFLLLLGFKIGYELS